MTTEKTLVEVVRTEGPIAALRRAASQLDAAVTGAVGTEKAALLMIPGRALQAVRNGTFLEQMAREYQDLVDKGKIKPDYEGTEQGLSCLQQILAALERPPVDQKRFDTMRRLFLAAATESRSTRDDPTPQLLMEIVSEMSPGEILVLAETYRKSRDKNARDRAGSSAEGWIREIASESPLGLKGLVEYYETRLMERKLLSGRRYSDASGIVERDFRLTDLGIRLCELLSVMEDT